MATFTDNFNRADETPLGSPYTSVVGAGLILSSNSVKSVDGGSYYIDALIGEDYDDDQYAEVELGTLGIFDSAGVGVRFNSGGSGYAVRFEPAGPDLYLDSFSSASQSELTVLENVTYLTGDTIGLGVVGNVLTIYRNGISVGTFTDTSSNHTSGVPALSYRRNNNGSTTIDNFSADGLVEAISIVNVDTDNTVTDGQQNATLTTIGFSGDITSINLKVGSDTLALTGLTGTGDSYTFDMNDVTTYTSAIAGLPLSSATYQNQIEVTDGTDTASIDITRNPKSGYAVVETVSAVDTIGSIFETRVGGAPADGSQIYYPTTDSTAITASGIITTDSTGFVAFVWDVTSKEWDAVTFDAADIVAPVITVSGNATTTITVGDAAPVFTASTDDGSAVIVGGDTVDANTVGTYVITFDSTDATGNVATQVVRTVVVEAIPDTTAPVITLNPATTVYNLNVDDVFVLPVATVTDDTDASRVITPDSNDVNTAAEGVYSVVYNATDAAGNVAETVTITVNVTAFNANAVIIVERQTNITYR